MWVPILIVVVAALLVGTVVDLRARRRGATIRGVDRAAARDARRLNEADLRTRSNHQDYGTGGFGF